MTPPDLLTEWARLLIGSLARAGVRDAVISPGSRSTPFTWAALNEPLLRTRVVIDERAAAFHAVGHAKMTGTPVLLVCTSGSAAANYFPAIVEADRSGTPLVVLTADRPFELQAADAPQTIDQVKLYGSAARHFFETGMPDATPGALVGLRRVAAQAALFARGPMPGPVHINARARQPLEPVATSAEDDALRSAVDRLLAEPATVAPAPRLVPPFDAIQQVARACGDADRGVIVCGPLAPWQAPGAGTVAELSRRTGFPVLAEATSQLRFVSREHAPPARMDAFDALLRADSFRPLFAPDVVLRIGGPPTSTAWRELMDRSASSGAGHARANDGAARIREYVIAPNGWSDPHSTAAAMLLCTIEPTLRLLLDALPNATRTPDSWRDLLARADQAARAALRARDSFDEGAAVSALLASLPDGAVLAVGNSLPVREVDTFSTTAQHALTVWSQRGANGIDGLIAGASGAAAATGRPTVLLLGDVSALHDIGSLSIARETETPLVVVVMDNGGGRIFEQLPLARTGSAHAHWSAWLTPPHVDFEAAARAFGVGYVRAESAHALGVGLRDAITRAGATLLHVVVDGERTIPGQHEYWAEVDRRFAALQ